MSQVPQTTGSNISMQFGYAIPNIDLSRSRCYHRNFSKKYKQKHYSQIPHSNMCLFGISASKQHVNVNHMSAFESGVYTYKAILRGKRRITHQMQGWQQFFRQTKPCEHGPKMSQAQKIKPMIQGPSLPSAWTWTSTQSPTLGGGVLGADTIRHRAFRSLRHRWYPRSIPIY